MVQLEIIRISFDGICQKYSKYSGKEYVCFRFHVCLLFINFSSFKQDTENNMNFDVVSSKCTKFDKVQFF